MHDAIGDEHTVPRYTDELAAFARELTVFRITQGKPSLLDVEKWAPRGRPLSRSAVSEVLNGKRLPGLDFLIALVQTLLKLGDPNRADVPRSDPRIESWRQRWQQLQLLQAEGRRNGAEIGPVVIDDPSPSRAERIPGSRAVRIFVAMPGTTMGQSAVWKSIPEIRRRLLDPIADRIREELGSETELVVEKDKSDTGFIHRSMFTEAVKSDVYIVDLTGANPNVYLELGVRWAVSDRVTIPICQDRTEVRFNVIASRVIEYGPMPDELQDAVDRIARAAVVGLRDPHLIDSPVRDGSGLILVDRADHEAMRSELERLREQQAYDLIDGALRTVDPHRRVELLERAIDVNPVSWRAYFELGAALRRQGRYEEAERALRTTVELRPDFAPAWREIGIALGKSGRSDDDAVKAFDRALELDGKDAETWATQGGLLRRLWRNQVSGDQASGDIGRTFLERSLRCYRKACELAPNLLYPLMNAARVELLLAGLDGADLELPLNNIRNLEYLARFTLSTKSQDLDPWAHFDLADVLLLTGRRTEGSAELRAGAALIPRQERTVMLHAVAEPLRDFLLISDAMAPETVESIQQALDVCAELSKAGGLAEAPAG